MLLETFDKILPTSRKLRAALLATGLTCVSVWLGLDSAQIAVALAPLAVYIGGQSIVDVGAGGSTRTMLAAAMASDLEQEDRQEVASLVLSDRDRLRFCVLSCVAAMALLYYDVSPERVQMGLSWIELHILGQSVADGAKARRLPG